MHLCPPVHDSHAMCFVVVSGSARARLLVRTLMPVLVLTPLVTALGCGGDAGRREGMASRQRAVVIGAAADEYTLRDNRERVGMYPLNTSICETLVQLTPDFRVEPGLATSWEYLGDNTHRFHLRNGVSFHDGQPFDARSAKYSLEREGAVQYSFLTPESVRIVDDTTIDVRPGIPNRRLVEQLVHPTYSMIAPGSSGSEPVCTGPFRLLEYVADDHITVVRYDDYWGAPAGLDTLSFRFIPDQNTRALALRSGELDGVIDVHRATATSLEAMPGIRVVEAPAGAVLMLYLATAGAPGFEVLGDRRIRRAVALAIDRTALAEQILEGRATSVHTVNPPAVLGAHADGLRGIPHDPVEAGRMLDEAGWRMAPDGLRRQDGRPLELNLIPQTGSVDPEVSQFVQAALEEVGIGVRIHRLERAAYSTRLNSGRFDLDIELPNQNDANPAFLLALRWYSGSDVASAAYMRGGPRFDRAVERALAAGTEDSVRAQAAEATRILLEEEVAAVPLVGVYRIYAFGDRVLGFHPHPSKTNQSWAGVYVR